MTHDRMAILEDVTKLYRVGGTEVCALDAVNLEVRQGDYIALIGPSGSGKSTLLNILGGIESPTSGRVTVDGERIERMSERRLLDVRRRKVAYIFQEARLLPSLTALENVMLPGAFSGARQAELRRRAQELLQRVGLGARMHHLMHQLSGGEAQRVCIARALVNRPRLVLADEPTGSLDHATRLQIVELLEALNREGQTVVMVTHDPELAARARRTVEIRNGRLEAA